MMRTFLIKTAAFFAVLFVLTEAVCRVFVDPSYYQKINTFLFRTERPSTLHPQALSEVSGVDFLFIGSSRVAAAINPDVLMSHQWGSTAINAGRGYLTSGIHYQAIRKRIAEDPDYLFGTRVLLELPGPTVFDEKFSQARMTVFEGPGGSFPHLILPHLDISDIPGFLRYSQNGLRVKMEVVLLSFSSTRRSVDVAQDFLQKKRSRIVRGAPEAQISPAGGIRNDRFALAREGARKYAEQTLRKQVERPLLSKNDLDSSMLSEIHRLVTKYGGAFYLFRMPSHSVFLNVYKTERSLQNQKIFDTWANERGIPIIEVHGFEYGDEDFPDMWHLRVSRRNEFTVRLAEEIITGSPDR